MGIDISITKSENKSTRKFSILPRIGFYVDFGGREISFRQVPIIETLLNLREKGFSMENFNKVTINQFREMKFPECKFDTPVKTKDRK